MAWDLIPRHPPPSPLAWTIACHGSAAPAFSDVSSVAGNITTLISAALSSYAVESVLQIIGASSGHHPCSQVLIARAGSKEPPRPPKRRSLKWAHACVRAGATASAIDSGSSGCSSGSSSVCASLRGNLLEALATSTGLQVSVE